MEAIVKEQSAGAVVYRITEDGQFLFLLLQPSSGKPWGFPKGKLNRGETEEQAARREVREETGLSTVELDPGFRHVIHYQYRRGRGVVNKDVTYFIVQARTPQVHLSSEHVAYRWAPAEQGFELVVFENARDVFRQALAFLRQKFAICESREV